MNLRNVKVGDKVWHTFKHRGWSERPAEVHLNTVTHIDKTGRLYICAEDCEGLGNWRYGFDPETGLSKHGHYDGSQLAYASPEGIAAYTAVREAKIDTKEAAARTARQTHIFGQHGDESYRALRDVADGKPNSVSKILSFIEAELVEEAASWAEYREAFRASEGSQITITWADLPGFSLEAVNQ